MSGEVAALSVPLNTVATRRRRWLRRYLLAALGGAVIALFAGERLARGLAEKRDAAAEPAPLAETV